MMLDKADYPAGERQAENDHGSVGDDGRTRRRAILVLGMHRSGTSAVSGVLARLGMTPPRTLMPATAENPRGYWESQALMEFHNRLLSAAGSRWADWQPIDREWFRSEAAGSCREELRDLIRKEFGESGLFVVKDPRICRFVPFWLEALRDIDVEPQVVLVIRNPLEVAASLEARDGFLPVQAQLLWLRHMLDAERATRHLPRSIVRYRDLMSDWRGVVTGLSDDLGLSLPVETHENAAEVDGFLEDGLRHHRASTDDLGNRPDVLTWTASAHAAFNALAEGDNTTTFDRLDAVRRDFDLATQSLSPPAKGADSTTRLALLKKDKALGKLQDELDRQRARKETFKRLLDARQRDLMQLYRSHSWRITHPMRVISSQVKRAMSAFGPILRRGSPSGSDRSGESRQQQASPTADAGPTEKKRPSLGVVNERGKGIDYSDWIRRVDALDDRDRVLIARHMTVMADTPRISIFLPIDGHSVPDLRASVEAVTEQLYHEWELWLIADAVPGEEIDTLIRGYVAADQRIRRVQLGERDSRSGMALAQEKAAGQWCMVLEPGDRLSEHALYLFAEKAVERPEAAIVYSDEDRLDAGGSRIEPWFKPDWDYDLFLGKNLIGRAAIFRMDLVRSAGGIRVGHPHVRITDIALRIVEKSRQDMIYHLPFVLHHGRASDGAAGSTERSVAECAASVINEHFARTGQFATAVPEGRGCDLRIRRALPAKKPLVSIVIPTKDQYELLKPCVDGLLYRTEYAPFEIIVVDNGTSESDALAFLSEINKHDHIHVIRDEAPFNFSRLVDQGVAASTGEICVLLNNDVDIISRDWLCELVSHAVRPEVGVVGAKLYYANDTLQHGGVVIGLGGIASHAHKAEPQRAAGYLNSLNLARRVSCVTGACLATRREVYDAVGGFNQEHLAVSLNDVDFCLRVDRAGYRVLWTPNAELYHYESVSRGAPRATPEKAARHDRERLYFRRQWIDVMLHDRFYNPNLTLNRPGFQPAEFPALRRPWLDRMQPQSN